MARRGRRGGKASLASGLRLQQQAVALGAGWLQMLLGAAQVIAARGPIIAAAATEPAKRADPELTRMVSEKVAAAHEGAVRLSRRAARHATRPPALRDPAGLVADGIELATAALAPFRQRVQANARRLAGRKRG